MISETTQLYAPGHSGMYTIANSKKLREAKQWDGLYVKASDYATLESQLTTITAERDAMLNSGAAANIALTVAQEQEDVIAEAGEVKRLTELLAAERERLCAPVSDAEWLLLCAGDHVELAEWMQRSDIDKFISARAALTAPAQEAQKENTNG